MRRVQINGGVRENVGAIDLASTGSQI